MGRRRAALGRLSVSWPSYLATHTAPNRRCMSARTASWRATTTTSRSAAARARRYVSDYDEVAGIRLATKHRIFLRAADSRSLAEPLVVSIDLSEIELRSQIDQYPTLFADRVNALARKEQS